jgi:hypothetical protein
MLFRDPIAVNFLSQGWMAQPHLWKTWSLTLRVAPDASSGVARKARNGQRDGCRRTLPTYVALYTGSVTDADVRCASRRRTRRFAPRGGRGVRPSTYYFKSARSACNCCRLKPCGA